VTEQQLISCSRWRTPSIDHIVCSQQRDTDLTVSTSSPGVHIFAAAIQCHTYLHTHMYKSSVLITLGKAATVPPNHTGRRTPNATPQKRCWAYLENSSVNTSGPCTYACTSIGRPGGHANFFWKHIPRYLFSVLLHMQPGCMNMRHHFSSMSKRKPPHELGAVTRIATIPSICVHFV
jgi:hypothetical protein